MGLTLTGPFRCGACGKPRGLGSHLCSPGRRRGQRTTLRNPVGWNCRRCGRPRGLVHACSGPGDFRARKRKAAAAEKKRKRSAAAARRAARRKETAAARRARDKARKAAAKAKPARPRPRTGESHEPGTCSNRECPKYGCKAYWQGMSDCLGPHEGD